MMEQTFVLLLFTCTCLFAAYDAHDRNDRWKPADEISFNELYGGSKECRQWLMHNNYQTHDDCSFNTHLLSNTLIIGDSTMKSIFQWLRNARGLKSVYYWPFYDVGCRKFKQLLSTRWNSTDGMDGVLDWDTGRKERIQIDKVLWNYGLHALHLQPYRKSGLHTLRSYQGMLLCMASEVRNRFPTQQLLYKLTNPVCHENFQGDYEDAAELWMHSAQYAQHPFREMQLTRIGTDNLNGVERQLPLLLINTSCKEDRKGCTGTAMHIIETQIVNSARSHELDDTVCCCSAPADGRHYHPIVPHFVYELAQYIMHQHIPLALNN